MSKTRYVSFSNTRHRCSRRPRRNRRTRSLYIGAIYAWADKTIYDMLSRREYLGHTVTAKKTRVSYKTKKERHNPPEKQYFFPDTHEPLIDELPFDMAQKRIATKTRPTKSDEIDLFSGLLYCADCEYKLYLQRGVKTIERKHAYTCGNYRNRARTLLRFFFRVHSERPRALIARAENHVRFAVRL